MKKAMFVVALAAVLIVALGGAAMAKGVSPANRSSSYLAKGESYIDWDASKVKMGAVGLSADASATVHGNYATTTVKCQVCHSAHKASISGQKLLKGTNENCEPCHLGATALTDKKVSAGNRHGGTGQCTNGYCHAIAPHGAGDVSKYATLKTAMLTNHADSLLDAAIASGVSGAPVAGNIYATGTTTVIGTIDVFNPGITAALLNDVSTPAAISFGRAVGTGYVCSNGGCHMNGAYNSLTADASFGKWTGDVIVDAAYAVTLPDGTPATVPVGTYAEGATINISGTDYDVWDLLHMRRSAIKGHTLKAVTDLTVRNVAFANVGQCSACHDSIDYRISNTTKQFPHGNTVVNPDGTIPATNNTSSAWFMLKPYVGGAAIATNGRSATNNTFTSGMDGACLKCHRADDTTTGVGLSF